MARNSPLRGRGALKLAGLVLEQFDPVDFHALVPLACGVTDALFGGEDRNAGPAQRTGVAIDILTAAFGHDEAEAFLVVEELDPAFDHRTGGTAIAAAAETITTAKAIATAETIVTAKSVTATETVAAAKAIATTVTVAAIAKAAAIAAATAASRGRIGRARIDAVHRHDLKAAIGILKIDNQCRSLRDILMAGGRQRGCVAEGVAAILKRDEAVAFCGIEPFDRALHRSL